MACNSYQTYHTRKSCSGCPSQNRWDRIYFPDFVANACCNPCCEHRDEPSGGCSICNGGGFGSSCGSGCTGSCGCHNGFGGGCTGSCGCHNNCGFYPNNCGFYPGWGGCCGYCPCGCQDFWGCQNGICPRF